MEPALRAELGEDFDEAAQGVSDAVQMDQLVAVQFARDVAHFRERI